MVKGQFAPHRILIAWYMRLNDAERAHVYGSAEQSTMALVCAGEGGY